MVVSMAVVAGCSSEGDASDGEGGSLSSDDLGDAGGQMGGERGRRLGLSSMREIPMDADEAAQYSVDDAGEEFMVVHEVELVDGQYEFVYQLRAEAAERLRSGSETGLPGFTIDGIYPCQPQGDPQQPSGDSRPGSSSNDDGDGRDTAYGAGLPLAETRHSFDPDHGGEPHRIRTPYTSDLTVESGFDSICMMVNLVTTEAPWEVPSLDALVIEEDLPGP